MKLFFRKKSVRIGLAVAAVAVLCAVGWRSYTASLPAPSGVSLSADTLTERQSRDLLKLCKVWGLAKYYHPAVVSGELDWDAALFPVMQQVLSSGSDDETNRILLDWLRSLGDFSEGTPPQTTTVQMPADTGWTADEGYWSADLSALLQKTTKTYIAARENSYATTDPALGLAQFGKENAYIHMDYADSGYRLLSLFRAWNIIEYYYPYRAVIADDWDAAFLSSLPLYVSGTDKATYLQACEEFGTRIRDSHVTIKGGGSAANFSGQGTYLAPLTILQAEGEVVVEHVQAASGMTSGAKPGDVIRAIDGVPIEALIDQYSKVKARSRDDVLVFDFQNLLLRTNKTTMSLSVLRDGQTVEVSVPCSKGYIDNLTAAPAELDERIGYINPGKVKRADVPALMESMMDKQGIIFDLRNYPEEFTIYDFCAYLMPKPVPFCMISAVNYTVPGEFLRIQTDESGSNTMLTGTDNPDYYKGKVAILMDERSMSQSEFTIMALRQAPNAAVIGSNSIGADGNVTSFSLPGGLSLTMTGLGVYTPDGAETQRVGLTPDIYAAPTIKGLREGRDELVEAAEQYLLE